MKKIILDCDPGMDDSMAIVMATKAPELDLLAVTTVNGNYPVEVTSINALKTLEMLGRTDIPVAKGMSQPLIRRSPCDPFTHGKDGQAEANLPFPKTGLCKKHAVNLIIDLVRENPGEISLVSTGPMTNIALAFRIAPDIVPLVKEVIAISGAFGLNQYSFLNATGDTPQSEWNVYVDPEAAKLVYESNITFTAIGLDVATCFDIDFSDSDIEQFNSSSKKEARFLSHAIEFVRARGYSAYCTCIDCMAVAYAIDASLIQTEKAFVGIETKEGVSLGMTVRDGRHHHIWNDLPEISIATNADYGKFLRLLKKLVLS
jgi:purine nucleosidase/pyrimidine-specific ribonucleoside hydrolase